MDSQFLFRWPTKLLTYHEDFSESHKKWNFGWNENITKNLWQRMIKLSEFFQYSFVLILKRKCLVGASRVRFGESGTPSTIIYTRWSSRRYELGCDASLVKIKWICMDDRLLTSWWLSKRSYNYFIFHYNVIIINCGLLDSVKNSDNLPCLRPVKISSVL